MNGRHRRDMKHRHRNSTTPADISSDIMELLEEEHKLSNSSDSSDASQNYPPFIRRALRKRGVTNEHVEGESIEGKGRRRVAKRGAYLNVFQSINVITLHIWYYGIEIITYFVSAYGSVRVRYWHWFCRHCVEKSQRHVRQWAYSHTCVDMHGSS